MPGRGAGHCFMSQPDQVGGVRSGKPESADGSVSGGSGFAAPRRVEILGVEVDVLTRADLDGIVAASIETDSKTRLSNHNLHSAGLCRGDPELRRTYDQADYIHCDGMPLVAWGRLMGYEMGREHRTTYIDWIGPLCEMAAAAGWRMYYLGGYEDSTRKGVEILRQRYPGLRIDYRNGFFDAKRGSAENDEVVRRIAEYRPNVLLVGMGVPRQELWVEENSDSVEVNLIATVGACIDYVAGRIPTPPRWAGRMGLEWLFRLVAEPRRLAGRYLVEPFGLLPAMGRDVRRRLSGRGGASSPRR